MPKLARPDEMKGLTIKRLEAIINTPPASQEMVERRRNAAHEIDRRGYKIVGGDQGPYTLAAKE